VYFVKEWKLSISSECCSASTSVVGSHCSLKDKDLFVVMACDLFTCLICCLDRCVVISSATENSFDFNLKLKVVKENLVTYLSRRWSDKNYILGVFEWIEMGFVSCEIC
jgi:hypothetical protein